MTSSPSAATPSSPCRSWPGRAPAGSPSPRGRSSSAAPWPPLPRWLRGSTLTPIRRWFFALDQPAPHHFNQSLLLASREPLAAGVLARAVAALVERHDAL